MLKQKLFALTGERSGALRLTSDGAAARAAVEFSRGKNCGEEYELWLISSDGALWRGSLSAVLCAAVPDNAVCARAAAVTAGGKIVSQALGALNRREAEAMLLRIRLALSEKPVARAAEKADAAARQAAAAQAAAETAQRAAQKAAREAQKPAPEPRQTEPCVKSRDMAGESAVKPVSLAGASIAAQANRLFYPKDADYDDMAFLTREPFRPRRAEPGRDLPTEPPAPKCAAEPPAMNAGANKAPCRRCSRRKSNRGTHRPKGPGTTY